MTLRTALRSPGDLDLVRAVALGDGRLLGGDRGAQRIGPVHEQAGVRDHDAVVDAEALVGGVDAAAALLDHLGHHRLEAPVAADAADNEDLVRADVRHGPLGRLHQHREDGLLEGEAEVLGGVPAHAGLQARQDARQGHVHALHAVRQLDQPLAPRSGKIKYTHARPPVVPLGHLLDVEAGTRVVGDAEEAGQAVEAVAHGNVDGLPEDAVALQRVRDDLRVPAAHVQDHRVARPRDLPAHLDVPDAVVHGHEWLAPEQRQCPRHGRDRVERRAHPGPHRVADAVDLGQRHAGHRQRLPDQPVDVLPVVAGRVPGQEARARRRDVRVPQVRQHLALPHDAHAQLIRTPFQAQRDHSDLMKIPLRTRARPRLLE